MTRLFQKNVGFLLLLAGLAIADTATVQADDQKSAPPATPSAEPAATQPTAVPAQPLKVNGTWLVERGGSEIMIKPDLILVRGETVMNNRELVVAWKNLPIRAEYIPYSQLKSMTGYNNGRCTSEQVVTTAGEKNVVTVDCDNRNEFGMAVRRGSEFYPPVVTAVRGRFINLRTGEKGIGTVTLDAHVYKLIVLTPAEEARYTRLAARYYGTSAN